MELEIDFESAIAIGTNRGRRWWRGRRIYTVAELAISECGETQAALVVIVGNIVSVMNCTGFSLESHPDRSNRAIVR